MLFLVRFGIIFLLILEAKNFAQKREIDGFGDTSSSPEGRRLRAQFKSRFRARLRKAESKWLHPQRLILGRRGGKQKGVDYNNVTRLFHP